ncbi:MAG: hypothetical protein H0W04_08870 [Chthoniobacterales bacterium]|nr:hypothetical protein [Chthoniobacterales bacterium]
MAAALTVAIVGASLTARLSIATGAVDLTAAAEIVVGEMAVEGTSARNV